VAVQTPVVPAVKSTPAYAAVGSTDTIPVGPTGRYLLVVKNAGGGADTVTITDAASVNPPSAQTPGVFNVQEVVPATTGERHFFLEAQRFRDANGNIAVAHSATASVTCIVYGPF
jgi:hypothetical protein